MDPDKATAWLKFLRELTATIIVYTFAIYAGYEKFAEIPKVAASLDAIKATVNGALNNTEETVRLTSLSCGYLARMVKESPSDCQIRKLTLGTTIIK